MRKVVLVIGIVGVIGLLSWQLLAYVERMSRTDQTVVVAKQTLLSLREIVATNESLHLPNGEIDNRTLFKLVDPYMRKRGMVLRLNRTNGDSIQDGWERDILFNRSGNILSALSAGNDGVIATRDDLQVSYELEQLSKPLER